MAMGKVVVGAAVLLTGLLLPLLLTAASDAACLVAVKNSVEDPQNSLSTWDSTLTDGASVCDWNGVICMHEKGNDVQELNLRNLGLRGSFPRGLENCSVLQKVDLANNEFSSVIPTTLCQDVKNLVQLDLSNNRFSGSIPDELGTCGYLNFLYLQDNELSGSIPEALAQLPRLRVLNVSSNKLSGPIPFSFSNPNSSHVFKKDSFLNNPQLCGPPLSRSCTASSKPKTGLIVGIAAGGVGFALIVSAIILYCTLCQNCGRVPPKAAQRDESKWVKDMRAPRSVVVSMFEKPINKIKLADLMAATNDFSKDNIIGSGRTGTVYKASFPDGSVMAIKRLQMSAQTDRQFKAEMDTLGMVKHRNLVPLLGYCVASGEKLLVYKHMSCGNLKDQLHSGMGLDWPTRVKVAIGSARGLAWLHHSCNPRIIHRNISASCILLDDDFEPRITDFGLARLMNPVDTHISTCINGDFGDAGYVAPEYLRTLVATVKGDVFSFGVVLLELVTGQKPVDVLVDDFKGNLYEWIIVLSNQGRVIDCLDTALMGKGVDDEVKQVLKVACNCTLSPPKERPSMFEVYNLLRAIGDKYQFTDADEMPMASTESGDGAYSDELIVAMTR